MFKRYVVKGHSMEPFLKDGDHVIVRSYLFFSAKVGDVVAARVAGRVLIKRVAAVEGCRLVLRGDNSKDSLDSRKLGPVEKKDVIGKVVLRS